MSKHVLGAAGALLIALAGVWLVAAPTALSYQPTAPPDAAWTDATTVSIVTGGGLLAAGLLAAAAFAAALVADLRAAGVLPERVAPPVEEPEAAAEHETTSDDQLTELLAPLAAALAEDLRDRERPVSRNGGATASLTTRR